MIMNKTTEQMEDSFSFSLNELESTLNDIDIPQDQVDEEEEQEEEEDSYIEIDLQPSPHSGELELRISFSSLPNSSNWLSAYEAEESSHHHTSHNGQTPNCPSFRFPITRSFSSSMSSTRTRPSLSHELIPTWESSPEGDNSTGREVSLKEREKAKVSPSELGGSSPTSPEEYRRLIGKTWNRALVGSRKPFRMATTLNGGVLMKFLIKLRSGKLLTTFMSFIKSYTFPPHLFKAHHHRNTKQETFWKYPRLSNPFQKWMALINTTCLTDNDDDDDVVAAGNRVIAKMEASKVVEMMDSNKSVKCKKGRLLTSSKSLPVTRATSPMGSREAGNEILGKLGVAEERDCSVRAAIAHCKRSFGEGIGR